MSVLKKILVVLGILGHAESALKLASYYADHMVLQRGPQKAVLWGFADQAGSTVTAHVQGQGSPVTATVSNGQWKLLLPAITAPGPFTIDVTSPEGHLTLHDVLFGDVWMCSGQSNMEFEMKKLVNGSAEVSHGITLNTIRYMKTNWVKSDTPVADLQIGQQWAVPNQATLQEFSAVCFLFAEYLQSHLHYPIGLLGTYWGGSSIEAWMPPEALASCPVVHLGPEPSCCPQAPKVLWNAKMYALRAMTIKGALWYQGETNAGHPTEYVCEEKAMIREWRAQFNRESMGQTSANFPFGYVQLAPYTQNNDVGGFPSLRWAQTADHGFSPNADLPNTFMAVSIDLPDYQSPYDPIHPRYKHDVAQRLTLGALNVAYGQNNVVFKGPFPTSFRASGTDVIITYDNGQAHLDIRNNGGFEICCQGFGANCDIWSTLTAANIKQHDQSTITIDASGCQHHPVTAVRYLWRTSPCNLHQCAVNDHNSGLPGAPFFLNLQTAGPMVG